MGGASSRQRRFRVSKRTLLSPLNDNDHNTSARGRSSASVTNSADVTDDPPPPPSASATVTEMRPDRPLRAATATDGAPCLSSAARVSPTDEWSVVEAVAEVRCRLRPRCVLRRRRRSRIEFAPSCHMQRELVPVSAVQSERRCLRAGPSPRDQVRHSFARNHRMQPCIVSLARSGALYRAFGLCERSGVSGE